jgi:hypothetical protein
MADKHKKLVTTAIVATLMIALVFRIPKARKLVTGLAG